MTEEDELLEVEYAPVHNGRSWSYRLYNVVRGTPPADAWEEWFRAHGFPVSQVPYSGWAVRDVERKTVSALVFWSKPDDELVEGRTTCYIDKSDDGQFSGSRGAKFAVHTIQLESEPLPFPKSGGEPV